jgi:hypothetical protein
MTFLETSRAVVPPYKFPQWWIQDTTQLLKERLSTGGPQIAADPQTIKSQIKTPVIVLYIGRYNYNSRKENSVLPLTNIFVHSFDKK